MESAEPTQSKREDSMQGVSVNIHAPCDNRIVAGDYIEVNIHLGTAAGHDREDIQRIVASAMDAVNNARSGSSQRGR